MPYEITVLEYARSPQHPVSGVIYGRHNAGTMNLPFAYVLVRSAEHVILVDCGYDAADFGGTIAESIGVTGWHAPREVLATVGVKPEEVTHLILTHGHFDHMGAVGHFPNAKVLVQRSELESWLWTMSRGRRHRFLMAGINPEDVLRLTGLVREGRLQLIDGNQGDVLPGIDLVLAAETHTQGSQYVVVRNDATGQDSWVLAGDLVYTYENMDGGTPDDPCFIPPGLATGSQARLIDAAEEMLAKVGGDPLRVVPVHEEKLSEWFPTKTSPLGLKVIRITGAAH